LTKIILEGSHGSMSPEQCRAARGWLNWSQQQLATAANVSLSTVRDFEKGRRIPIGNNLVALQAALESQGMVFTPEGVAFAQPKRSAYHPST
jgi:DNA-binding transcriptional regulator YiaG